MAWPFAHNWSVPYVSTFSFRTDILTSRSGIEQRRCLRNEPRRTVQTTVLDDSNAFTRFLWATQASLFTFNDPVTGEALSVRLPATIPLERPTSRAVTSSIPLSVEPGTGPTPADNPLLINTYGDRYVAPFNPNWTEGVNETWDFPRQTVDFESGRIAVTRPVAFGSRTTGVSELRVGLAEVQELLDFFTTMRGRQREFWVLSPFDDFEVLETVSTSMRVTGRAAFDIVDTAVGFVLTDGSIQYREVEQVAYVSGNTVVTFNTTIPALSAIRRVGMLRLCRFASDDMTIEWVTSLVAQIRVQVVSLPFAPPSFILCGPPLTSYDGGYDGIGGNPLDMGLDGIGCTSLNAGFDDG